VLIFLVNRNLTILIAEDNENEAILVKHALGMAKITNPIQMVQDGQEAIDYLSGNGQFANRRRFPFPSVLMLDLKMPRRSGFEVLAWLREHPQYSVIPSIVLSNSSQPEDIRLAYERGANSYIVKPQDLNDLVRIFRDTYEYWKWCEKPPMPS